ncbi:MAG: HDIG domain-containing protein [candidate division WOR-3 bacterium]|nr:HDIG domain-containing protein [candidate division WOR-3 bacterium]MCX7836612.1 HDIG domain-containing protein [candidate division WOR-3 bacterium]MDW8113340.1 HDIG domain-containing protein [candidate division WOR-3 bacterium]
MEREEALKLVSEYIKNENLKKHSLAVEACMRKLARYFNENEEKWGLCGLLHDLDYEETNKNPEKHGIRTIEILKEKNFNDPEILNGILAHCEKKQPENNLEKAIYAIDPLTGLIVAACLMHPDRKLKSLDVNFVLRRFKEKKFASGANREQIKKCEELGLSLEKFIEICLLAMQEIDNQLGL